jgi:hypothetical protein
MSFNIDDILKNRELKYGSYVAHSLVKETILYQLEGLTNWDKARPLHRQAAAMIVDKLVRAFNGDPNYEDNWVDIQGYAKLVEDGIDRPLIQIQPEVGYDD